MIKRIVFCGLLLGAVLPVSAQKNAERDVYLGRIRQYFNQSKDALSYQYNLTVSGTDHKNSNTLNGYVQVGANRFYDSCQAYIQVKNKDYVLQVNRESKTISLVGFSRYKALTGMDPEGGQSGLIVNIPLEALDSAIQFSSSKVQGNDIVEFTFRKQLQGFKFIRFKLSGSTVSEVEMSMVRAGEAENEQYTIRLFNLKPAVKESLFGHSRFYRIVNGKALYEAPYKTYQHFEVI